MTFTAVVTPTGQQGTPTGTVTFKIDGQAQAPVPLSVVGGADLAQFVASTLTRGQHSVVASYSGDSSFGSSTVLTTLIQRVNPPGSTTTLASSAIPSKVGDSVTFTATVTAGSGTFTPSGEVTFSIDGRTEPPVSIQLVDGHDQASFSISTLSAGQHSINATYDGGSMFAESSVITPLTQTVGGTPVVGPPSVEIPTVALVQRFGIHNEPTVLVVTFTAVLDSASAQDLENYVIVGPSGRHIAIDSAVYDASAHTVTLRPSKKINLHHDYQFTIIGTGSHGVAGVDHTLLDGAYDGKAASNCVTTLNWKNVVLTPSAAKTALRGKPYRAGRTTSPSIRFQEALIASITSGRKRVRANSCVPVSAPSLFPPPGFRYVCRRGDPIAGCVTPKGCQHGRSSVEPAHRSGVPGELPRPGPAGGAPGAVGAPLAGGWPPRPAPPRPCPYGRGGLATWRLRPSRPWFRCQASGGSRGLGPSR